MMSGDFLVKAQKRYDEFRKYGLPHDKASYLFRLMYELTPCGFEEYVRRYLYKVNGIKGKVIGSYGENGNDIIGTFKDNPLLLQCKKRSNWYATKPDIMEFWQNVKHHHYYTSGTRVLLISTNRISKEAKAAAKEKNIFVRDYKHLLKWKSEYSLDAFIRDTDSKKQYFTNYTISYNKSKPPKADENLFDNFFNFFFGSPKEG